MSSQDPELRAIMAAAAADRDLDQVITRASRRKTRTTGAILILKTTRAKTEASSVEAPLATPVLMDHFTKIPPRVAAVTRK